MARKIKTNEDASGQIRREALDQGARNIRLCTQAYGTLKEYIKGEGQSGGICRSLVLGWIADRKGGQDFFTKMLGPGGVVNASMVGPMVQQYKAKGKVNRLEERAYITSELVAKGLESCGCQVAKVGEIAGPVGKWFMQTPEQGPIGPYRLLGVRDGYDHAMGLDLHVAKGPIFFDPNWGEFEFPDYVKLTTFLNTSMFTRAGAGNTADYADFKAFHNVEKSCFS